MKSQVANLLFSLVIISCGHKEPRASQEEPQEDQREAAVDQLFNTWNTNQTPGVAIGVIEEGKLTFAKGYGFANLEHKIPNTTHTAFNIASNTKQFTAACISLLVLRGDLRLSQTVHEFFPEYPSYFNQITINHLLHHTSGLRDFSQITYLSGLRPDDYYGNKDIRQWLSSQKELNFSPGEQYLYSNSGYWLLGEIVAEVSGMALSEFAKQEIFIPLNMSNTQFYDDNTLVIKDRASGYSRNLSGGYRHIYSMLEHTGNGGIYATINDLKKWDNEFYKHDVFKGDFWEIMSTRGILNNGEVIPYANGLIFDEYQGLKVINHGGRAPGYQSNIMRFPNEKTTIILLANAAEIDATRFCHAIADIFLADQIENTIRSSPNTNKVKNLSTKQLDQFTGSYWSTENAISRKVTLINDTLRYERGRGRTHPLLPIGKSKFKMLNTPHGMDVLVHFIIESNTRKMIFMENGSKVDSWEVYEPVSYTAQELKMFAGKYYSVEIDTHYEIKIEDDAQVFLYINGERTIPMRAVMDKLFSSPMGIFHFSQNTSGQITDLRVSSPRVKNLHFINIK